jgi:hypothetical protein
MVLVTNKHSNILQDIETVHLFSRAVSESCRTYQEREVAKNAFELIFAFDEIIALGYAEGIDVSSLRTILEMDSAEERIQAEIERVGATAAAAVFAPSGLPHGFTPEAPHSSTLHPPPPPPPPPQSKEREAKEQLKLKMKMMELQKREAAKRPAAYSAPSGYGGAYGSQAGGYGGSSGGGYANQPHGGMGGGYGGGGPPAPSYGASQHGGYGSQQQQQQASTPAFSPSANANVVYKTQEVSRGGVRGMQLGRAKVEVAEVIKADEGIRDGPAHVPMALGQVAQAVSPVLPAHG